MILNDSLDPAVVEIWQVDGKGAYLHSRGESGQGREPNFQGFGRFLTGKSGEYYFRTIKPVRYPGRTPHIPSLSIKTAAKSWRRNSS
ncbi:MAG: hypothetical protein ACR2NU_08835 [Aeoliella sp.]